MAEYKSSFDGILDTKAGTGGSDSSGSGYKSSFDGVLGSRQKRAEQQQQAQYGSAAIKKKKKDEEAKKTGEKGLVSKLVSGVGNFVKDAAVDIYQTTRDTGINVAKTVKGAVTTENLKRQNVEQDRLNKERGDYMATLSEEDYKNPQVRAKLDELNARGRAIADKGYKLSTSKELKESNQIDAKKFAFQSAETALNVGTLGAGTALKQVGKQTVKQAIKMVAKKGGIEAIKRMFKEGGERLAKDAAQEVLEQGAKSAGRKLAGDAAKDATIGAAYGVTQTGKNNSDAHLDDYLLNVAYGAGAGAALPLVGAAAKKAGQKIVGAIKGEPKAKVAPAAASSDVNAQINQAIDEQSGKYGTGIVARVKNWVGDQIDPNRAFAEIDDAYARENKVPRSKLNAEDSLEDLARRSAASEREAAGLFEVKTPSGKSAKDLIVKYKGNSDAGKEFNNYTNAKFDLEFREKNGGKKRIQTNLEDEQLQKFVEDYEKRNPDAVADLQTKKEINDMAVDYMANSGAISKTEAKQIKKSYKNAVPLERVFPDDLARSEITGKNVGSIAKQTVIQRLEGGSDIPLSNSFDTMLNRVYKAVSQGNRAKLAQKILERHEQGLIEGGKVLVGPGNKEARVAMRDTIREINKGVRHLSKKVSISSRQAGRLKKELDKLNIEGLEAFLGKPEKTALPKQAKTVTVKTVAEHIKDNAPKKLDDLKQSYNIKADLLKEYGPGEKGIQQMAADIINGGYTQLMALNPRLTRATAESIATQVLKKPTITAAKTIVKEGKSGRVPTAKQVIGSMLNAPTSEILKIQKKIAAREPKLAAKIDEILNYKTLMEANKAAKMDMKEIVAEFSDDPTTGKQVISGLIDGQSYKLEVPPAIAKAVQGLDSQKLTGVLKAFSIIKKPFEVTWTGVLNPVFSGISFALYDTPMSVINSPQGFKTLAPKAIKESFKSLKSSSEFQRRLAAEGARPYGGSGASSFAKPDAESIAAQASILSNIKYTSTHPEVALSKLDIWGGRLANMTRTRVARAAYDDALKIARKAGEDVKDIKVQKRAMENAALAYRTVMPDFDTMSNLTRQINSVVPFFAASVAGTRSFGKALRRDPLGTSSKALAIGIAPTVGVTAFSMMQPAGQKFYKDMEASGQTKVLDDNLIIVLPGAHKNKESGEWTGVMKIPLAPEFRAINQTTWRSTRQAMGGEGPDASHVALSLFDAVTGGVRTSENPLISARRILSGEDPRTGERIIKGDMANLPKEEQIYASTSKAGQFVGKVLNTSPVQGDKLLGQFGLVGATAKNGGKPVEAVSENVGNRFAGARGETAANAFFGSYSPVKAKRDRVSKEVTDLVKQGKIGEAKRKANDFNETLPGRFSKFSQEFGDSDVYDPAWDDMLDGLAIRTTEKSFKSRREQ
jgi:hypothetical protein